MRSQPQLLTRPWLSGLGFGLVVYVFMGVVQIMAGRYHRPSPIQFELSLLAHVVFYGLPVGLIVARALRRGVIAEIAVDLDAIARNAAALARLVAPARLSAVIKADAYGHGLVPVARALAPHAARLCVYALEEAVALREAGIAGRCTCWGRCRPASWSWPTRRTCS